jgi:hypothetical protein
MLRLAADCQLKKCDPFYIASLDNNEFAQKLLDSSKGANYSWRKLVNLPYD